MKTILDLLKGKTLIVPTDAKVDVELIIESVEEKLEYWDDYSRYTFQVTFVNGYKKTYNQITQIKLKE